MRRRRSIAWIALFATLFSAVSPALAAVFAPAPAVTARMLGLPAPQPDADRGLHAHHMDHEGAPEHTPADGSTHESHGVFCSFCLNPSSLTTLAAAPAAIAVLRLEFDLATPLAAPQRIAPFLPQYRSRAPPRIV